jgi:hypothetical protein
LRRALAAAAFAACGLLSACGTPATEDNVVDAVPADARAYVHADTTSDDWKRAKDALKKLPTLESGLRELLALAGGGIAPGDGEGGWAYLRGGSEPIPLNSGSSPAQRSLDDLDVYQDLLRGLPPQRFVHGYLSKAALGPLRTLDRTITAAAGAADVTDDGMRIRVRTAHDGAGGTCSAGRGDSGLPDIADPRAAIYLEVPSIACAVRFLATHVDGVGKAFGAFARAAERRGGVSLRDELLPLLEPRGVLMATPGKRAPTITLIVDQVDEEQALDVLARLQPALIHLVGSAQLGQAPTFGAVDVAGVTAATARIAPGLELTYAAWDGRLVVSTSRDGIAAVRKGDGLPGSDAFEAVLGDRPSDPSALLFLDLDQLLALGEQAGLAEDPRYLAVRDDLQKLRAAGAVLSREEKFTTAELTFQIP